MTKGHDPHIPPSDASAQAYFNVVGCQTMNGTGSSFYSVNWQQDALLWRNPREADYGLLDAVGNPVRGMDVSCASFQPDASIPAWVPKFARG